jgi:hypothetical protein
MFIVPKTTSMFSGYFGRTNEAQDIRGLLVKIYYIKRMPSKINQGKGRGKVWEKAHASPQEFILTELI